MHRGVKVKTKSGFDWLHNQTIIQVLEDLVVDCRRKLLKASHFSSSVSYMFMTAQNSKLSGKKKSLISLSQQLVLSVIDIFRIHKALLLHLLTCHQKLIFTSFEVKCYCMSASGMKSNSQEHSLELGAYWQDITLTLDTGCET